MCIVNNTHYEKFNISDRVTDYWLGLCTTRTSSSQPASLFCDERSCKRTMEPGMIRVQRTLSCSYQNIHIYCYQNSYQQSHVHSIHPHTPIPIVVHVQSVTMAIKYLQHSSQVNIDQSFTVLEFNSFMYMKSLIIAKEHNLHMYLQKNVHIHSAYIKLF